MTARNLTGVNARVAISGTFSSAVSFVMRLWCSWLTFAAQIVFESTVQRGTNV